MNPAPRRFEPRPGPGPGQAPALSRTDRALRAFVDPAAEFVPAARRVFGEVRVLDGSRSLLVGETKLALEAGERELWLIETHGALERRLGMVEVRGDVEAALRDAKARLGG